MLENMLKMNLQLFGEGGDGGAASGAEGTTAVSQPATGTKSSNPLANVKYGKQEGEADTPQEITTVVPDKKATFEELIKGEYKDEYNARMQEAINRRFKANEASAQREKSLAPILEMLGNKYGIDASDVSKMDLDKLNQAIREDDSYYEQEALDKGISVDMLKQIKKMESENKAMKQAMEERQRQEKTQKAYAELLKQAEQVKTVYPGFDLKTEMNNPQFGRLIANNVDAKTAYEVVHMDEIKPAMAQYVTQKTAEQISANIQAGARRPAENGVSSQGASTVKTDVNKLTRADRQEIARRAAMGEKIRF